LNIIDLFSRLPETLKIVMKIKLLRFSLFVLVLFLLSGCNNSVKIDTSKAKFVGRQSCVECHDNEYDSRKGSDHDMAMDTAVDKTVLGDFNNAVFEHNGFKNRFYKKDGKFYVHTLGPEGKPGDFQIAYTFGYKPLQQYLIPFEKGRYQCLQLTWDTERKTWYHMSDSIHKNEDIPPDDWLYWTNNGQNWNGMCAECHSTNLRKNYNPETHEFHTTWSEIDVSCEACHGPASEHVKWAKMSDENRPEINNYALVVKTSGITNDQLISQCAYCHARRSSYEDFIHPRQDMFDIMGPQLPVSPIYHVDGQILEEDYVYSSFTQTKMYMTNVKCTDCHDVHSLKVKYNADNRLCEQCHLKRDYDTPKHHHHKYKGENGDPIILNNGNKIIEVGEGTSCVKCHMPGNYYMGVDFRRDHSMRIPRPDLTVKIGTPNACNSQCHQDKSAQWATSFTEKWYGKPEKIHFAETFHKAINGNPAATDELVDLMDDNQLPPILKAAAVMYAGQVPSLESNDKVKEMLGNSNPMVRKEAVTAYFPLNDDDLVKTIFPLLKDTSRLVRLAATTKLTPLSSENFSDSQKDILNKCVKDYINTMLYSADFAPSRHNLGIIYADLGNYKKAEDNYLEALRIDNKFYPSKMNLALLYNRMGKNKKAEMLLKDIVKNNPEISQAFYSLGLLEAEMGNYEASADYLSQATQKMPDNARVYYNLAKVLQFLNKIPEAEKAYLQAYSLEPSNSDYLAAVFDFYMKTGRVQKAKEYLKMWIKIYPNDTDAKELLEKL
jgi:tetratricopeptide (TPR) repeat protein